MTNVDITRVDEQKQRRNRWCGTVCVIQCNAVESSCRVLRPIRLMMSHFGDEFNTVLRHIMFLVQYRRTPTAHAVGPGNIDKMIMWNCRGKT